MARRYDDAPATVEEWAGHAKAGKPRVVGMATKNPATTSAITRAESGDAVEMILEQVRALVDAS
jgi:hypothetical protein